MRTDCLTYLFTIYYYLLFFRERGRTLNKFGYDIITSCCTQASPANDL